MPKKSIVRRSVTPLLSAYAHYPSYHSDSSAHRKPAHVGLCACRLGLLSRRRFAPPDYSRCPAGESLAGPHWLIVRRRRPLRAGGWSFLASNDFSASCAGDRPFQRRGGLGVAAFARGKIGRAIEVIRGVVRESIHRDLEICSAAREMPV